MPYFWGQKMKVNALFSILSLIFLLACSSKKASDTQAAQSGIAELESVLKSAKDVNEERETAEELVQRSLQYALQHPQDPISPAYLFKAADVSRGMGHYDQAISLWTKVYTEYPSHEKAADALFLKALTYDKDLVDKNKAKQYFNLFISKYPDHKLVSDAQLLLNYVDKKKSDLDLIKEFQKKSDLAPAE